MTSSEARRDYTRFRTALLSENFRQLQNSLYARHFPTIEAAEALIKRMRNRIPAEALVSFFLVTDKQFGLTREFLGPKSVAPSLEVPQQVELFS